MAAAPMPNFEPTYRVTIDVQRFESVPGHSVLVEAMWTVHRTEGGETRSGRTMALARLSGDIAAAIWVEAEDQP